VLGNFASLAGSWFNIGGKRAQRKDVHLILLTGFGGEEKYIDEWLRHYSPRRPDARDFALMNRVLLLRSVSGLGGAQDKFACVARQILRTSDFGFSI
jgi:hypothetical protein